MGARIVLTAVAALMSAHAFAQSDADLKNADKETTNVLTYGMNYTQNRFSPLAQINRDTVKRLTPAWAYSLNNNTARRRSRSFTTASSTSRARTRPSPSTP